MEVEVPCRVPCPLPEANVDAVESGEWFLQASPESCMKRLLAAGYPRIFTIHRAFRKGERGGRHLPEFSLLEWYRAEAGYTALMDDCERLVAFIAKSLGAENSLVYGDFRVDLKRPWPRLSVSDAFARYAQKSAGQAVTDGSFDYDMAFAVEPALDPSRPVFLCDYPKEKASLARISTNNTLVAERFELYAAGLEIANGFSELNDAEEQRRRFADEEKDRRAAGKPPYPAPEKFLEDLSRMPPAAGIALGLDRLVMLFADAREIDEVTAFTPEEL